MKWKKIYARNKIYYRDDYGTLWEQSKDSWSDIEAEPDNVYKEIIFKEFSQEEYEEYRDYKIDKQLEEQHGGKKGGKNKGK